MMLTDEEIDALWPEITLPQKVARREILRKGIAANNAKVLADLKPWQTIPVSLYVSFDLYHKNQVSALIQRNEELTEMLKPFAALSQDHQKLYKDNDPLFAINGAYITYGDVRKAKKATP